MKRTSMLCTLAVLCMGSSLWAGLVDMTYEAQQLSENRWQYTYMIQNNALAEGVSAFTLWFDQALYANLSIESSAAISQAWDEEVAQPDPLLVDDGFYDVLENAGAIPVGQTVTGFSVAFDWLGADGPAGQPFEVFNPADYSKPVAAGSTVPEPTTMSLFALGTGALLRKRRQQ